MADYRSKIDEANAEALGPQGVMQALKAMGDRRAMAQRQQAEFGNQQDLLKLRDMLQQQEQQRNIDKAMNLHDQLNKNRGAFGARANVKIGDVDVSESQPGVGMYMKEMGSEANKAQGLVDKALKPKKEALDAAENSLNLLDNGDEASFKQALMNEAKLYGGSRGVATLIKVLDPSGNIPGLAATVGNFLSGKGEITATPDMMNNLRKAIYTRTQQIGQDYQNLKPQLQKQIQLQSPMTAQMGNIKPLQENSFGDFDSQLDRLSKKKQDYIDQATAAANQGKATYSNPQPPYSPKQGVFSQIADRVGQGLAGLFGGGKQSQPAQQPNSLSGMMQPQTIRVRHKASGQTGILPANEFDPSQYEKIQ